MGLEDVDRGVTERLGLLPKGERPADRLQRLSGDAATAAQNWNDGLQASVKNLGQEARGWLKNAFGDQISIEGDSVAWRGENASTVTTAPVAPLPIEPAAPAPSAPSAPVSNALANQTKGELADQVKLATSAIDGVHDDGQLPSIPVQPLKSGSALGMYEWGAAQKPVAISIRPDPASWPGLTTAHEIGHFIDHQVLGTRGVFASISHEALADFRAAVAASDAMKQMQAIMPSWAYYLDPRELWARSYAQYIATKSGNPALLAQLDRVRVGPQKWRQWSDEDFKPIAAAIDELFRKKGWLK